ncbi:7TM receptor with intracellular HD hydrolase [Prevotella sp. DNF00663]|uniref:HD family phosphohydrolase n=1 Tax=unclassified Prevotella TaxID=2638335 RepID=UPI000512EA13|nr:MULTISPECIES: HDIG domain-containing metalloprotein [unclassified Prevotella]KGI59905.1 hydrolase [Prevotella sp. S7 MS 2]KXB79634.1 7TM receptor with intracellular HD hydrolase [Prevotella sp. DNF00663]
MRYSYKTSKYYWRNLFSRLALISITVAVIVWFLPRNEVQHFRYDVGKPWMYGSFIAKFDFPIYKTDEILKSEQDSMMELFQPYYNYNSYVEKQQVAKFKKDFANSSSGLTEEYKILLLDRFHRLYQAGIMKMPEYNVLAKDSTNILRIVNGKKATGVQINCIYSTMTAYEQLFQDEKLAQQRPLLQRLNLNNYIVPNLEYDSERSETEKNDILSGIPIASGMVMSGQKIIDRGEIVDDYVYRVLSSFEREMSRRNASKQEITYTTIGQCIFVFMLITLFTTYLALFRRDYFRDQRSIMMLYSLITIFPILVSLMMSHSIFSVYILPFAMVPIFIRVFMDSRTAFIAHCTMILISAAAVKYQYEFIIIQLVAGLIAIYSLRELSKRSQVFKTALLVTVGTFLVYFALQMMQNEDVSKLNQDMYYHFIANGIFLLLTYPMMYLIEKAFGFTSDVTLFELSNTNKGLLRDMSEIAPGTFQHSITVGNLAAEIANKIGANSLLVRTGALYHDIGKMENPVFFTENQVGINPHDNMTPKESAQIIINHVPEGVKMAEKNNLPSFIKDFIVTHHGRGVAKYFYVNYKNAHPDEEIDMESFTYPGPNPFTREQAILMMADTVEAASRSLPEYTEESISALVNKLIDAQVADGFFTECPITFRDISQAKQVAIERLKAIYHTRISYPELKKGIKDAPKQPTDTTGKPK